MGRAGMVGDWEFGLGVGVGCELGFRFPVWARVSCAPRLGRRLRYGVGMRWSCSMGLFKWPWRNGFWGIKNAAHKGAAFGFRL
jgi:hypothetical protein